MGSKRFSEHFGLIGTQADFDFVDIPLDTDVPLFVDPYAFKIANDDWSIDCNNLVVDFFQCVLDCVRAKSHLRGKQLLKNLSEPNETRLGLSEYQPQGRGLGHHKATDLYTRLSGSAAATTGFLKDLSDCELMVPGISFDTISDIAVNIIRGKLITFTQEQCKQYGLPVQRVPAGVLWNDAASRWESKYAELPVYDGGKLLLVPKEIVRYKLTVNHRDYYNEFVLKYLEQEHLSSNTALVEVLKSGKRSGQRRVTKKRLKEEYPINKAFLYDFSKDHPDVLEKYKRAITRSSDNPLDDDFLEYLINEILGRARFNFDIKANTIQIGDGNVAKEENNTVHGDNIGGVIGRGTINARDIWVSPKVLQHSIGRICPSTMSCSGTFR
jgi:hypothetical protein